MVTAPVQKSVINDAGMAFTGHTEFLAERTGSSVVMMLVGATASGPMRVALATTHIPLSAVPAAITEALLVRTVRIIADDLVAKFRIAKPRIAVCGLNPHAGEGGYLGREEIEIIAPALAALRTEGIDVAGPLPADTVFVPAKAGEFDCVVAMYHDQGLPVLKHASFGHGVNVTLGLPIVRTSVDHGTSRSTSPPTVPARAAPTRDRCSPRWIWRSSSRRRRRSTRDPRVNYVRHAPRKRFGQNFLVDRHYIDRIVGAVNPAPGDTIVEIGPGLGALTRPLLEKLERLTVIEIDRDLAARLSDEFAAERLSVHTVDALTFDFSTLGSSLRVVGNLPYNISSPMLFHLAQFEPILRDITVMLQREVVQRMAAAPATPDYGRLSVMLQSRFRIERLFTVPPGAFRPSPLVDSRGRAPDAARGRTAENRTTKRCSRASLPRRSVSVARPCATRLNHWPPKKISSARASRRARAGKHYTYPISCGSRTHWRGWPDKSANPNRCPASASATRCARVSSGRFHRAVTTRSAGRLQMRAQETRVAQHSPCHRPAARRA